MLERLEDRFLMRTSEMERAIECPVSAQTVPSETTATPVTASPGFVPSTEPYKTRLALDLIRTDGGTQLRTKAKSNTIADYADAMRKGAEFLPVLVVYDGQHYWLVDGFHRVAAAKQAGKIEVLAEIYEGTLRDALLHAVKANATNGLPRSNADKRAAVKVLLQDEEWGQWSDGEIARRCAVSDRFVSKVRKKLSPNGSELGAKRKVKRGGKTFKMRPPSGKGSAAPGRVAGEAGPGLPPGLMGRYPVIVVTPLWGTMSPEQIQALPVPDLATRDAVLWLHFPSKELLIAQGIVSHWGFRYEDMLTLLDCFKFGTGYHFMIAVRGTCSVTLTTHTHEHNHHKRGALMMDWHFYDMVEKLCPSDKPKLGLGIRGERLGWDLCQDINAMPNAA